MDIHSLSTIFLLCIQVVSYINAKSSNVFILTRTDSMDMKIKNIYKLYVNYGRAEYLNPQNLSINYLKGANCRITVLKNDPYNLQIGAITPTAFPCKFHKNTVLYQHFGSLRQMTDTVKIQIQLDTNYKTLVTTTILHIQIVYDKPLDILKKVDDLIVDELGGLSRPISGNILSVNFNAKKQFCTVCFMPKQNGPPFYGDIVNTTSVNDMSKNNLRYVPCGEFLSGKLRYAHNRARKSSRKDYIPLVIEVTDKQRTYDKKREYIQVPVRIRRAANNIPPKIDYNSATYSLQVDQLVLKAVTPHVIRVLDKETPSGSILLKVTVPATKEQGYLVHTSDPTRPVTTFYQKEIEELKIAFKPPEKLSTSQRLQQIWMEARDSEGAASTPFYLMVVIKPMNSYAPQIVKNVGLAMFEGQSRVLSSDELSIRDPDNEQDIIITVEEGLFNGRLENNGKQVLQFTIADIDSGVLRYVHDDSDTYNDAMRLSISDSKHQLSALVTITILPKDDEPPQLVYNTGVTLNEGGITKINQFDLSARDIDTDDTKINFEITQPPKYGYLIRKPAHNVVSTNGNKVNMETRIKTFSQVDVILGNIFYQHNDEEEFNDFFRFRLSDGNDPPNLSGLKTFIIDINPVDDISPKRHPGCPLKMTVVEGESKDFTRTVLRYTDDDSNDNNLIYQITRPPYFVKPASNAKAGRITLSSDSTKDISKFTQRQINHFKIKYHPPESETGVSKRYIRFIFNVTDTSGNFVKQQLFLIELIPVNNQAPIGLVQPLIIYERERRVITTNTLKAFDNDNYERDLSYIVKKKPKHGDLLLDGKKLQVGTFFTPEFVKNGLLEYSHNGDEMKEDSIKLVLTDGIHLVPVHIKIDILPSDDEKPEVKVLQKSLTVVENGFVQLNAEVMEASDEDSEEEQLTFIVTSPLKYGSLMKTGAPIDGFKWMDLRNGLISYHHTSGEIGSAPQLDELNLNLTDLSDDVVVGGNINSGIKLDIQIIPFDSEPSVITGSYRLVVSEAGKAVITRDIMLITDEDTDLKEILCNITKQPTYGFIESSAKMTGSEVSRSGTPIDTFSSLELTDGLINYVQSRHSSQEPTSDIFHIKCGNGNNTTPEVTINVAITPTNDEVPFIYVAENIICVEDDLVVFDLTTINPYDADKPQNNLIVTITKQPKYGELLLQQHSILNPAVTFTRDALIQNGKSAFMYQHKGSETTSDFFVIVASDGKHKIEKIVNIKIVSMDDETPRLIANTGLRIERGNMKVITLFNLRATDLDSNDDSLKYIVMVRPAHGKLQMVISPKVTVDINKGGNFTQRDINQRKIRYTHTGESKGERDVIRLDITDGFNRLINQMFTIMIEPEDNVLPSVFTSGVRLNENDHVILTTEMLSASDLNTPDEMLQYIITKTPLKGFLQNLNNPNVPITKFTQLQLASNKISYFHNSKDEIKVDNFEFEVTDGQNKVFRTFRIQIDGVNNKKPTLFLNVIEALQGTDTVITPFELNVIDIDTAATDIDIKLHDFPKHGLILLDNNQRVVAFTQDQIETNRIIYRHDGTNNKEDSFAVTISDGKHDDFYTDSDNKVSRNLIKIPILIQTVDKKAPTMLTNEGASLFRNKRSVVIFKLSANVLQATDVGASDGQITFSIKEKTKYGAIVNVRNKQKSISKFTQKDINKNSIVYILSNTSIDHFYDSFIFNVYDNKKNVLPQQVFQVRWSHVAFTNSSITVYETEKLLKIHLTRQGNLDETAYLTLNIFNDTALYGVDFIVSRSFQLQFNPQETFAEFEVSIIDNSIYEKQKQFNIGIESCINTVASENKNVSVTILDPEDEPTISMETAVIYTTESINEVTINISRSGDVRDIVRAICYTKSGTAKGTEGSTVKSFTDYITKTELDRTSIITLFPNETFGVCKVRIIDDSLYEGEESFEVHLLPLYGGNINKTASRTTVVIQEDPDDEPVFSFDESKYKVDESDGTVKLKVKRQGTDLSVVSYVLLATKQSKPISAKAYMDYRPLVKTLKFNPGVSERTVRINIIDDQGREKMEGEEEFEIVLLTPRNARLSNDLSSAIVIIDDKFSDLPKLSFSNAAYTVNEKAGFVAIPINRRGDLKHNTYVRCFTRQNTAIVNLDFTERTNTNESFVHFKKNERTKECLVSIINDNYFETTKNFKVHLGIAVNGITKDDQKEAVITILDDDQPIISFNEQRLYVREPAPKQKHRTLNVVVTRHGDISSASTVMVMTKDGSAKSSRNYQATAKNVQFAVNETKAILDIKVFHDPQKGLRTAFSILLVADEELQNFTLGLDKVVVFIQEAGRRSSVTFPLEPVVVSLLDYDRMEYKRDNPIHGYPLVCVTACDHHHPKYSETKHLCKEELINNILTSYQWQVGAPSSTEGTTYNLKDVNMKLFFTSPYQITLDSIYFNAGSRIRCSAQPFAESGNTGIESFSKIVTVDLNTGLCMPRRIREMSAETFSVQADYTGVKDSTYNNMIKIKVVIPHYDGLLPVISTRKLSNFELSLSPDASRTAQHTCSNLLTKDEITTQYGFLRGNDTFPTNALPRQYDVDMRGVDTVRLYKNLDLDSCLWTFDTYYNMTEIVETCGGKIITDGLVKDASQSHLTVDLPLFVSYIYHSANDVDGWVNFNYQSSVRLTAVYNTGILWRDGVALPEKAKLKGNLYPTSIVVRKLDRKLQVNFRTKARFRGLFILQAEDGTQKSEVMLLERPSLPFQLKLLRSEPSYSEPEQLWQMESKYAVGDYTGSYVFRMLPCTVMEDTDYSIPPECTPGDLVSFHLNLTIQQTSEPVEASFTLNTRFLLLNNRDQWVSNELKTSHVTDVYFKEGQRIYGRVMVDSMQALGNAYHIIVEKVFLCSGLDGYIPAFDPKQRKYGCIADSETLTHRFKILDRLNPDTSSNKFSNIDFNATLAIDDELGIDLIKQSGSDGFSLDSTALFKVSGGRNWFLHVIYTLRSKESKHRGLGKRSIEQHIVSNLKEDDVQRNRRSVEDMSREIRSIDGGNKGTNLQMILLERENIESSSISKNNNNDNNNNNRNTNQTANQTFISIIVILVIVILVGLMAGYILYKKLSGRTSLIIGGANGGTEI